MCTCMCRLIWHFFATVVTAGLQRPPMGSSPNIVRRDPYQPPSTNDPDTTFRNNTG